MLSAYNGKSVTSVTLQERTLWKDGAWNTLCLPFAVANFTGTPLEGATVKTLVSSSFNSSTNMLTLNFTEDANNLTSIEAGKPYIVKWTKPDGYDGHESDYDIENPVFTGVTISNTTNNVETSYADFIGNTSPITLTGGDNTKLYLGSGNTLYYPSADKTINACRAYFQLNGIEAGTPAGVKEFRLNFGEEDDATSLTPNPSPRRGEEWFDLSGRKLDGKPSQKGLYINDGKKVVLK